MREVKRDENGRKFCVGAFVVGFSVFPSFSVHHSKIVDDNAMNKSDFFRYLISSDLSAGVRCDGELRLYEINLTRGFSLTLTWENIQGFDTIFPIDFIIHNKL